MKKVVSIFSLMALIMTIICSCGNSEEKAIKVTPDSEGYVLVGQWVDSRWIDEDDPILFFDAYGNVHRIEPRVKGYCAENRGPAGTKYMPEGDWVYANGKGTFSISYYGNSSFTITGLSEDRIVATSERHDIILERVSKEEQIDLEQVLIDTGFDEKFSDYLTDNENDYNQSNHSSSSQPLMDSATELDQKIENESKNEEGNYPYPSITYEGMTFEVGMTVDEEEMEERFRGYGVFFKLSYWNALVTYPGYERFGSMLEHVEYEGKYIQQFSIDREGALLGDIEIGDPYEKILEIYPMAQHNLQPNLDPSEYHCEFRVFYRDGNMYSKEEFKEKFFYAANAADELFPEQRFGLDYDTVVLEFTVDEGKVDRISISNGRNTSL